MGEVQGSYVESGATDTLEDLCSFLKCLLVFFGGVGR